MATFGTFGIIRVWKERSLPWQLASLRVPWAGGFAPGPGIICTVSPSSRWAEDMSNSTTQGPKTASTAYFCDAIPPTQHFGQTISVPSSRFARLAPCETWIEQAIRHTNTISQGQALTYLHATWAMLYTPTTHARSWKPMNNTWIKISLSFPN